MSDERVGSVAPVARTARYDRHTDDELVDAEFPHRVCGCCLLCLLILIKFQVHIAVRSVLTILLLLGGLVVSPAAVGAGRVWLETLFCRAVHASQIAELPTRGHRFHGHAHLNRDLRRWYQSRNRVLGTRNAVRTCF